MKVSNPAGPLISNTAENTLLFCNQMSLTSGWVFLCCFYLCKDLMDFHSQQDQRCSSTVPNSRVTLDYNRKKQCSLIMLMRCPRAKCLPALSPGTTHILPF